MLEALNSAVESPATVSATQSSAVSERISDKIPSRKSRSVWMLLALMIVLLAVAAWAGVRETRKHSQAHSTGAKTSAVPVVAAVVHKGSIPVYLTGLGTVTPLYTVTAKSRVDGEVTKVLYTEGRLVRKGEALIEIDSRPYEAQLAQYKGQLAKDQAALQMAQTDLQRYQSLLLKNAIAQQQVADQLATVLQDEGAVKTDEANIRSAQLDITYCHITSPIDGRVGLRLVDPGNMIYASSGTPLVVITQVDPISIIFTLPEQELSAVLKRVRAGERLAVEALDADSKSVIARGQLTTLDNEIDQTTGTLKLRAVFSNRAGALFPNQFVNAQLLVEQKRDATLVANAAIQRNGSKTFVYLVKPDRSVTVREVTVGASDATESEIASGIAPGDVLVTQGVDKLQEGSVVAAQIQQPVTTATSASAGNSRAEKSGASPHAGQ